MKFSSCCLVIFLVCVVSFHQTSSFRIHHGGKPDQNEINMLLPGRYYIQNVATGLVIGAVNGQYGGDYDIFGSTMESLDEAQRDPEQKSKVLWELHRTDSLVIAYIQFRSVGPYENSDLEKTTQCMYGSCVPVGRNWYLFSRGRGIWGIRDMGVGWAPWNVPLQCLTGYGLHQGIDKANVECNVNDPNQSWRLIREDSS